MLVYMQISLILLFGHIVMFVYFNVNHLRRSADLARQS